MAIDRPNNMLGIKHRIWDLIDRLPNLPRHVRQSMKKVAERDIQNLSLVIGEMELMYRRAKDNDTELMFAVPHGSPHPWQQGPS